jgi:hypothetical protein
MKISEIRRDIRAVARGGRDFAAWIRVCAVLDEVPDDVVRAHVDEIDAELDGWSAGIRHPLRPWIARLRAEGREPRMLFARVLGLAPDPLWRVLESPDIARIHTLSVARCGIDEAAAPELARRLAGIRVTRLDLSDNPIGAGIRHVLPLSLDGAFTALDTDMCRLAGAALETLAAEGTAFAVEELRLGLNHLGPRDVEHLAGLPGFERVRLLSFDGNKFLAAGVRALVDHAGPAGLAGLRELDLGGTQCGPGGAAILATDPAFARVETLDLRGCSIKDAGAAALAAATSLTSVRELNLAFNDLTAAGAGALLASTALAALERLDLSNNEIGDGVVDLIGRPGRLESLTLDDTYLSDRGRDALLALPLPDGLLDLRNMRDEDLTKYF